MKMVELFEMYKNLDMKERIKFDREYIRFNKEEELKQLSKMKEIENLIVGIATDSLMKKQKEIGLENEEGQPYFSSEWVKENILNSKQ